MCRLILARGTFKVADVLGAAVAMATGQTADHDGPITCHPNGWGAIWRTPDGFGTHRDVRPIGDSADDSPLVGLDTDFLAVHARHATLPRNHGLACTHPLERHDPDGTWYFMHNGFMPTVYGLLGLEESAFDSAEYFDYAVPPGAATPDGSTLLERLAAIPPGGNSGNAIAVGPDRARVIHWSPEPIGLPRYFTMHRLEQPGLLVIASEIVPALAGAEHWRPVPAQSILDIPLPGAPQEGERREPDNVEASRV
ncbi:hypothetical protein R8Z50_20470 [Longispora sp. K20-0274]|uniref:class II glutamine amidotransferase n=1 Tax=Longispora sp. K20-0274 TaxID=3088255 RepID=UPI00399BCCF5